MKHDMNAFIKKFLSEGMTANMTAIDKELTLASMGFGDEAFHTVVTDVLQMDEPNPLIEIEEAELLQMCASISNAVLSSMSTENFKKMMQLTFEQNAALVGGETAEIIRKHHVSVAETMRSNLTKMLEDAEFRASVAAKCHLKIVH